MSYKAKMTSTDWESLQLGVLATFFGVASADGKVDKEEIGAFAKGMSLSHIYKNPLASELFESVTTDLATLLTRYKADGRNQIKHLMDVADILDRAVSQEIAEGFKRDLLTVAIHVANATGGFLGFGEKISKDEKGAIATMAVALRVAL